MDKLRTHTKIAVPTAAFVLAAALILSACANPSDSSNGNGGTPETPKYEVKFKAALQSEKSLQNLTTESKSITAIRWKKDKP